jgi:hypothetical protein
VRDVHLTDDPDGAAIRLSEVIEVRPLGRTLSPGRSEILTHDYAGASNGRRRGSTSSSKVTRAAAIAPAGFATTGRASFFTPEALVGLRSDQARRPSDPVLLLKPEEPAKVLLRTGLAEVASIFPSSAVCLSNDIRGAEADRKDPTKRPATIASGALPTGTRRPLPRCCRQSRVRHRRPRLRWLLPSSAARSAVYLFGLESGIYSTIQLAVVAPDFLFGVVGGEATTGVHFSDGWAFSGFAQTRRVGRESSSPWKPRAPSQMRYPPEMTDFAARLITDMTAQEREIRVISRSAQKVDVETESFGAGCARPRSSAVSEGASSPRRIGA